MAKLTVSQNLKDYEEMVSRLGRESANLMKMAVFDGGAVVIEAVKEACPKDTGDLRDSFGLMAMAQEGGYIYTKAGCDEYDRRKIPNSLKARAIIRGTRSIAANDFVGRAVRRCKGAAEAAMAQRIDDEITKRMK